MSLITLTKNLLVIVTIFLTVSVCAGLSFGCSLEPVAIDKFDAGQYVFIDKVVAVAQRPYQSEEWSYDSQNKHYGSYKVTKDAFGIQVEVAESINLPKPSGGYEVYPLHLTASCGSAGWDRDELVKSFPIGSKVAVIAREAGFLKSDLSTSAKILETTAYGGILTKIDAGAASKTSATSVYQYGGPDETGGGNYSLPEFELAKDLRRLSLAQRKDEKTAIMKRLLFYPNVWVLDFPKIVQREIMNGKIKKSLIGQWGARKQKILDNINHRTN